jgi:hypothetical protein
MVRHLLLLLLLLPLFLTGSRLLAQAQTQTQTESYTLAEALPNAYWNVDEQGALLAIAPERTLPAHKDGRPPIHLPPPPSRDYNMTHLLAFFNYKTLRSRTVTAIAPATMRVFTRPNISPEEASYKGKEEAASALFATFTAAQWKLLGSENGIGMVDLSDKQQKIYAALLPKNAKIEGAEEKQKPGVPPPNPVILTPTQIKQIRFRVAKAIDLEYLYNGGEDTTYFACDDSQSLYELNEDTDDPEAEEPWRTSPKVQNRLKPSDLNYQSTRLNAEIPLKNIQTVAGLIKTVAKATQLTLHADARIGPLPLYLRGESARAGDLLEALCISLMGAFRKMPDGSYLLTEDREGIGTRIAAWVEWQELAEAFRRQREYEREAVIRKNGFLLVKDNPYNLSLDVQKKIRAQQVASSVPNAQRGIDTSLLPTALQKKVREGIANLVTQSTEEGEDGHKDIVTDRVEMTYENRSYFIVPGFGQVGTYMGGAEYYLPDAEEDSTAVNSNAKPTPKPPVVFPKCWEKRSLILYATTPEEAKQAVTIAHTYGFSTLSLAVPALASQTVPLLQAALLAGKSQNIAIGAYCDVFYVGNMGKEQDNFFVIDRNIFGETGDEFSVRMQKIPDNVTDRINFSSSNVSGNNTMAPISSNMLKVQSELVKIIQSPELKSLKSFTILSDIPDNYLESSYERVGNPVYGYSVQNRLDFFKKNGIDPIDFYSASEFSGAYSPYFFNNGSILIPNSDRKTFENRPITSTSNPDYINIDEKWVKFCIAQFSPVEKSLFDVFKTSRASLPLYYEKSALDLLLRWETPVIKKVAVPYISGQNYSLATARAMQKLSPELWRTRSAYGDAKDWAESLINQGQVDGEIPFLKGLVIDLSGYYLTDTKPYLEAFKGIEKKREKVK